MPPGAEIEVLAPSPLGLNPIHGRQSSISSKEPFLEHAFADSEDNEAGALEYTGAASFTNLPALIESSPDGGIKRTFSENVLSMSSQPTVSTTNSPYTPHMESLSRAANDRKVPKSSSTKFSRLTTSGDDSSALSPAQSTSVMKEGNRLEKLQAKTTVRAVSGTLKGLVKKPWMATSRPPSPEPSDESSPEKIRATSRAISKPETQAVKESKPSRPRLRMSRSRQSSPPGERRESVRGSETPQSTRIESLISKARRPLSAVIPGTRADSEPSLRKIPSLRSLRSNVSVEAFTLPDVPTAEVPPIPKSISSEKVSKQSLDSSKRKDPLWGPFRTLEGDYQKFQTKSSALKVNVIRSSLLPFLTRYVSHPSNLSIRLEDLDRRVMILNKWWIGLMEMLNGRNNHSVFGTDRPIFLEAITGIMTRPEWRVPPLSIRPTSSDDTPGSRPALGARSSTSVDSSGSDYLAESIYNNVRNIFVQNLLSQMVFVVDKMSMKTTPASLVTFCGKACAYAFFFCPGVGDMLTRLWTVSPGSLRRVLSEFGIPQGARLRDRVSGLLPYFPEAVRAISFDTHAGLCRRLRQQPQLPLGAASIRWFSPWIKRWNGRESDLYFTFTKHFHILVAEFLPDDFQMEDRPCIPGLVLIHAQLLTVLEATLYRQAQASLEKFDHVSTALFDDIEGPDVPAATMPFTAANAVRSMGENRLIILLRDLLTDSNPEHQLVRQLYATSFDNIIKAAAQRMSLFNNDACFVLCDFMEEALAITFQYQVQAQDIDLFDWQFWLRVCQKMMESHNTLTQVRVFAFVYAIWPMLIQHSDRRKMLCLDWLLDSDFFFENFSHWCPMVRGYFFRLLCWRLARIDEEGTIDGCEILETLYMRLDDAWSRYRFVKKEAESQGLEAPSSAPCSPAPGRRLVILRTDTQPLPPGLFMSFDPVGEPGPNHQPQPLPWETSMGPTDAQQPKGRRWSMLKNIVPFSSPGNTRPGEVTPPGSSSEDGISNNDSWVLDAKPSRTAGFSQKVVSNARHQAFSFKFSLEWLDHPSWASKNRQLSVPKLPHFAQSALEASLRDERPSPSAPSKPPSRHRAATKYSGRALAEWAQVVSECDNFFDRRRDEGVPASRLVETPTLSVESFRMFG